MLEESLNWVSEGDEGDFAVWESEGGRVLNPETFDMDYVSKTFEVDMALPAAERYTQQQLDYFFTSLIADSIRHVRKFFLLRASPPTKAEKVGEFVTVIRRLFHEKYYGLQDQGFKDLTNTEIWDDVAVPNGKNEYKWKFLLITSTGTQMMTCSHAKTLCENAMKMAQSDQTLEEEFREINADLDSLMTQTASLNMYISRAKELNAQSDVILIKLRLIAEELVST